MLFRPRRQGLIIWRLPTQLISNQTERKWSKGIIKSCFQIQLGSFNRKSCGFFFLRENYILFDNLEETAVTKLLALKLIVSVPPLLFTHPQQSQWNSMIHFKQCLCPANDCNLIFTVLFVVSAYSSEKEPRCVGLLSAPELIFSIRLTFRGFFLQKLKQNKTKTVSGSWNQCADTVSCHRWLQGSLYALTKPLGATFRPDGSDLKKLKSDVKH